MAAGAAGRRVRRRVGNAGQLAAAHVLSRLESALRRAADDLTALRRRWALVGGLAVSARVEPRFTRDIDLAVAVTDDRDAENLLRDLQARGYRVQALMEQEATGRLATARLAMPSEADDGVVLDILLASSGIEGEVAREADALEIFGALSVPVATIGHLVALKLLARDDRSRPQDHADLLHLVRAASPADIEHARRAVALIQDRGFHRGRRLADDLARLLADRGGQ